MAVPRPMTAEVFTSEDTFCHFLPRLAALAASIVARDCP